MRSGLRCAGRLPCNRGRKIVKGALPFNGRDQLPRLRLSSCQDGHLPPSLAENAFDLGQRRHGRRGAGPRHRDAGNGAGEPHRLQRGRASRQRGG